MKSNLIIRSNLWIDSELPETTTVWMAERAMPGDLRVELIGSRDTQILRGKLTDAQYREYCDRRFFLSHGEQGVAYEES